MYQTNISHLYSVKSNVTEADDTKNIVKFVNVYKRDRLFDFIPNREHGAFPKFRHQHGIPRPGQLKSRLKNHLRVLDEEYYGLEIHGLQV